jgi:hypothetical protein
LNQRGLLARGGTLLASVLAGILLTFLMPPVFAGEIISTATLKNSPSEPGMTKLLSVSFKVGRPKLNPNEENTIHAGTLEPGFRNAIGNPAATLVVVGYIDCSADNEEDQRTAFRRAQLVVDTLRDKCGVSVNFQAITFEIRKLPANEQRGKERLVEVWVANL